MNFEVIPLHPFVKQLKRLARKFPSLKQEISELAEGLADDPRIGIPLGGDCFKIRISIRSKGTGRSGGARVITHVKVLSSRVYLLSIYDKSEKETLTDKEIKALLRLME